MRVHLATDRWAVLTPDKSTVLARAKHVVFETGCELVMHGEGSGWLWVDGKLEWRGAEELAIVAE